MSTYVGWGDATGFAIYDGVLMLWGWMVWKRIQKQWLKYQVRQKKISEGLSAHSNFAKIPWDKNWNVKILNIYTSKIWQMCAIQRAKVLLWQNVASKDKCECQQSEIKQFVHAGKLFVAIWQTAEYEWMSLFGDADQFSTFEAVINFSRSY